MAYLTKHGAKRIRERVNVSKRQLKLVLERGKPINVYSGSFRRYLDRIRTNSKGSVYLLVYGNNIYILSYENALITVLNIPSKYAKYKARED